MQIRLHGTQNEIEAFVMDLSQHYELQSVSRFYSDRARPTLGRVYVDAVPYYLPEKRAGVY